MRNTFRSFLKPAKAALPALLCLCLLLTGCGGKEENIITVYSTPEAMVNTYAEVPAIATAEPTPIPTVDPNSEEDIAWGLAGLDSAPVVTPLPQDQPADVTIGYIARTNNAIAPYECTERDLVSINHLMFESVVELDAEQKPVPLLADRWVTERDEDGHVVWTFELREGIQFHNGAILTSTDVIDSYTAIAAAGETNPYYDCVRLIRKMEYLSDTMFRVYARYDGMITLYGMTFPVVQAGTLYTATPRGTGPYWLIAYEPGSYIRLEANPLWWKRPGDIKTILCKNYANTASALLALNTRDIDMLASRSYSASQTRNLSNMIAMDYTTPTYEMLVPNLSNASLLSDTDVRKAIMYAIDYNTVVSSMYLDMAQQCEVPIPPGSWLYESRSAVYYHSPERAMQYLYDSGWQDLTGDTLLNKIENDVLLYIDVNIIVFDEPNSNVRGNAADQIAEDLRRVGINATVEKLTRKEVRSRMKDGAYDIALVPVNLSEVPDLIPLLSTNGSINYNKYSSQELDNMLLACVEANDEQAMKLAYSNLQLFIVDNLPVMGLCYRTGMVLSTRPLTGLSGLRESDAYNGIEFLKP